MPTPWISNRYLSATRGNLTRASTIGNDVDAALTERGATDPAVQVLSTYFKPLNAYFQQKFATINAASGAQKGATRGLTTAFDNMRAKANQWKKEVGNVYDEGSEEYVALLPNGIGPFTKGKQTSILREVEGFSMRLTGITTLSATKTDVDATYLLLSNKNSTQKGKKSARDVASEEGEQERINLCNALLYVEAGLTQIFLNDLPQIDSFFPVDLLRRRPQTEFTNMVKAGEIRLIVKRTMDAGDEIRVINNGDTSLTFYFAPAKNTPFVAGMPSITLTPTQDVTVPATELGASDDNIFLIVKNASEIDGHWLVEL